MNHDESRYSPFPWKIQFCDSLNFQYIITDSSGGMVAIGEFYSEYDLTAFVNSFIRNKEIIVDSQSFNDLLERRKIGREKDTRFRKIKKESQ